MDASIENSQVRELDRRRGYGIEVALLWEAGERQRLRLCYEGRDEQRDRGW
jgi:hypothetical protein